MAKDYLATQQWVEERLGASKMVVDIVAGILGVGESVTLPYVAGATMAFIDCVYKSGSNLYPGYAVVKNLKSSGTTPIEEKQLCVENQAKYSVSSNGYITFKTNCLFTYAVTYYA